MKRILHISDLHFGRIHPPAIESLEQFMHAQENNLDLIIATGDWTQRAKEKQFKEAAEFIKRLKTPVLSVPGNHDISLYNFWHRYIRPLGKYDQFIRPQTISTYKDKEIAVIGLATAHFSRFVEGRLFSKEVDRIQEFFSQVPASAFRVIASHHPFYNSKTQIKMKPLKHVSDILDLKPHMILSGHYHLSGFEVVEREDSHKIIHLSAGSATSNRLRGEVNGFHILEIKNSEVEVVTYNLTQDGFTFLEQKQKLTEV